MPNRHRTKMPNDGRRMLPPTCGCTPELIAFEVNVQVALELVVPGYRRVAEQTGVRFGYDAAEAVELVAEARP
jgi:hypothetical protein